MNVYIYIETSFGQSENFPNFEQNFPILNYWTENLDNLEHRHILRIILDHH